MNNKRFYAAAVLACLAMLAQSANAAKGFKYSYGEFGYYGVDAPTGDGDGFRVAFSFGATDYVNIIGEYNRLFGTDDVDELNGEIFSTNEDIDRDEFKIGFGVHYPVMDNMDLTFTTVYVDQEYTGDWVIPFPPAATPTKTNVNIKKEGYEVELGARIKLFKKFEMTPHVIHKEVGDDSNTGGGLGVVYKFYKKFSVRAEGTFYSDDSESEVFAGVRLNL
jgi:hypothetical protein